MFHIPKCRRDSDLGLCPISGLAKRMRLCGADFEFKNVFGCKICWKLALRSSILFASLEVVHRPESYSPLHFNSQNIFHVCMETWNTSARRLLPGAGRRFATSRLRLHYFEHIGLPAKLQDCFLRSDKSNINQNSEKHFVSTTTNSMKYLVNWIPLRIRVRSRNIQPHLNQPRNFQLPPSKPLCQALPARLATSLLRTICIHSKILNSPRLVRDCGEAAIINKNCCTEFDHLTQNITSVINVWCKNWAIDLTMSISCCLTLGIIALQCSGIGARGKQRGLSPGAATRNSLSAATNMDFLFQNVQWVVKQTCVFNWHSGQLRFASIRSICFNTLNKLFIEKTRPKLKKKESDSWYLNYLSVRSSFRGMLRFLKVKWCCYY